MHAESVNSCRRTATCARLMAVTLDSVVRAQDALCRRLVCMAPKQMILHSCLLEERSNEISS